MQWLATGRHPTCKHGTQKCIRPVWLALPPFSCPKPPSLPPSEQQPPLTSPRSTDSSSAASVAAMSSGISQLVCQAICRLNTRGACSSRVVTGYVLLQPPVEWRAERRVHMFAGKDYKVSTDQLCRSS